jgi:hypothetical protein
VRDTPYFWPIVAAGIVAFVAELAILYRIRRAERTQGTVRFPLRSVALSAIVALTVPCIIVVAVNRGRGEHIKWALGLLGRHWESPMFWPQNQILVLLLGSAASLPSILLAAITATAAATQGRRRVWRMLFCFAAPAMLLPFFVGIGLSLYRLANIPYPNFTIPGASARAPIVASTLAMAKHGLEVGTMVAGLVLTGLFVLVAGRIIGTRNETDLARTKVRPWAIVMALLATSAALWWVSRPLAIENLTPWPSHPHDTWKVFPPVPSVLSQDALYELSTKSVPPRFPFVRQKQEALVERNPVVQLSSFGVTVNGISVANPHSLFEELVQVWNNERLLHGDEGIPLIAAMPNIPMELLADVLAVIYRADRRKVRLVTGLPETIQRPFLGPLSRIIPQSTTVIIASRADEDMDPTDQRKAIPLSTGLRQYRELLDRIFEKGQAPSPNILLIDPEHVCSWSGWED